MDEQAMGGIALGLVGLIMLAFLVVLFLPRGGTGALLLAATIVLVTVFALVAATEGRRR